MSDDAMRKRASAVLQWVHNYMREEPLGLVDPIGVENAINYILDGMSHTIKPDVARARREAVGASLRGGAGLMISDISIKVAYGESS